MPTSYSTDAVVTTSYSSDSKVSTSYSSEGAITNTSYSSDSAVSSSYISFKVLDSLTSFDQVNRPFDEVGHSFDMPDIYTKDGTI